MKALTICLKGVEETCSKEITEILGRKAKIHDTAVAFSAARADIAQFAYESQSAVKVLELLGTAKVSSRLENTITSIRKCIEKIDFGNWLVDRTFRVKAKRIGEHDYTGPDVAPPAGETIINKTGAKVSLKDPDIIIYVYIYQNNCYIGIDYSGFDLSKRDYKVFTHASSLNATIAYTLVRQIESKKIMDPFCGAGTIPIEAALFLSGRSPHFFKKDKFAFNRFLDIELKDTEKNGFKVKASDHQLNFVRSTKNNAKLAGAKLEVSRMDIEWLDTKLDKKSVDIVTHPPYVSRHHDEKHIDKLYKELFYQADYVVKDMMVLCVNDCSRVKKHLEKFKIVSEFPVWQGKQELCILAMKRK